MVEPTVVSTQASSSPSYGPNIAPARMFCKMTNVTRCYCLCNIERSDLSHSGKMQKYIRVKHAE